MGVGRKGREMIGKERNVVGGNEVGRGGGREVVDTEKREKRGMEQEMKGEEKRGEDQEQKERWGCERKGNKRGCKGGEREAGAADRK